MAHIADKKYLVQNVTGYHPGPVMPQSADGTSLGQRLSSTHQLLSYFFSWAFSLILFLSCLTPYKLKNNQQEVAGELNPGPLEPPMLTTRPPPLTVYRSIVAQYL